MVSAQAAPVPAISSARNLVLVESITSPPWVRRTIGVGALRRIVSSATVVGQGIGPGDSANRKYVSRRMHQWRRISDRDRAVFNLGARHHCRFRTINVPIVAFLARRRPLLWRERTAED
jgi:hypothetical protein